MRYTYPLILICSLLFCQLLQAQQQSHVLTEAKKGDGIYSLLARYELPKSSCIIKAFKILNHLDDKEHLIVGKSYELPIAVHIYNGTSIRSTLGIKDYEPAKAIADYNDRLHKKGLKSGNYRKDNILWRPYKDEDCKKLNEVIVTNQGRNFPIFGSKHKHVPLIDNSLRGTVFYVVAGHGGPDPGAVHGRSGGDLCEDEYAYDVSLRLARNLLARGATTYVITRDPNDGIRDGQYLKCDKDEYCWPKQAIPINQKERLTQRSSAVNELYEKHAKQGVTHQRVIMIHVDARNKKERADIFFYHFPGEEKGEKLSKHMYSTIKKKYAKVQPGRGYSGTVSGRDLHMLRETEPLGVYIELGNIKNAQDQKRIKVARNRQLLADWLFDGLYEEARW